MEHRTLAIVLAAGNGTRMQSSLPKVMHTLKEKPMLCWVWDALNSIPNITTVVTVVSPLHADVQKLVKDNENTYTYTLQSVTQPKALGTGHAVRCAIETLQTQNTPSETTALIAYGDTPGVKSSTFCQFLNFHHAQKADISIMGFRPSSPKGYGRIVQNQSKFVAIREEKDCTEEEKHITLCNSGFMCAKFSTLATLLPLLNNQNNAQEFYLTDVPWLSLQSGGRVSVWEYPHFQELLGVNSQQELMDLTKRMMAS